MGTLLAEVLRAIGTNPIPLNPFNILTWLFSNLLPPHILGVPPLNSWCCCREMGFLAVFTTWIGEHSHTTLLLCWGRGFHHRIVQLLQCCLVGVGAEKIPLTLSSAPKSYMCVFTLMMCWNLRSGTLVFLKFFLFCEYLHRSEFSRYFSWPWRERLRQFHWLHNSGCLPITRCTCGRYSPQFSQCVTLDCTTPAKVLPFMGGCLICCFKRGKMDECLIPPRCWHNSYCTMWAYSQQLVLYHTVLNILKYVRWYLLLCSYHAHTQTNMKSGNILRWMCLGDIWCWWFHRCLLIYNSSTCIPWTVQIFIFPFSTFFDI